MSSFGGPGSQQMLTKPTPPQRGSFPLDHDGECKHVMKEYLDCMRKVRGVNQADCRGLAKAYLACRMDRNLMAKDDFKNLGFDESIPNPLIATPTPASWSPSSTALGSASRSTSTPSSNPSNPSSLPTPSGGPNAKS